MGDAQASELSARMGAMGAATDNAAELAKDLTQIFNKRRQAYITQEISEISAGANMDTGETPGGPELGVFDNEESLREDLMKEIEGKHVPDQPDQSDYADAPSREEMLAFIAADEAASA